MGFQPEWWHLLCMERAACVGLPTRTLLVETNTPRVQPHQHLSLDLFLSPLRRQHLPPEHGLGHHRLECNLQDHLGIHSPSHTDPSFLNHLFHRHRRCLLTTDQIPLKTHVPLPTVETVDYINHLLLYVGGTHWMAP